MRGSRQRSGGKIQRPAGTSDEQSAAAATLVQNRSRSAPAPGNRPAMPTIATRSEGWVIRTNPVPAFIITGHATAHPSLGWAAVLLFCRVGRVFEVPPASEVALVGLRKASSHPTKPSADTRIASAPQPQRRA